MTTIRKSFKREIAVLGLAFWVAVTGYLVWGAAIERVDALGTVFATQTAFTWGYTAAAFGMHALATQFGAK